MARHSSPRPPSAPFRFSAPRPPLTPAFAPVGGPAGLPLPGVSTPRTPRYPDVSDFTGGRPAPARATHRRRAPEAAPRPVPSGTTGSAASAAAAVRGRVAAAAVAVGALATAGHSLSDLASEPATTELAAGSLSLASVSAAGGASDTRLSEPDRRADSGGDAATSGVLAVPAAASSAESSRDSTQVASLAKGQKRAEEAVARAEAARAPQFVKPAEGRFTSGYGARWGSSHKGVDIAGPIGTPILAVADGVVTAAGPASGFGQWVKVRHDDGTETVYGHVNRFFVSKGDEVKAGEEIAEIGNRGQSTGPHLHFEVHSPGGTKMNPLPWLAEHGISLGAQKD